MCYDLAMTQPALCLRKLKLTSVLESSTPLEFVLNTRSCPTHDPYTIQRFFVSFSSPRFNVRWAMFTVGVIYAYRLLLREYQYCTADWPALFSFILLQTFSGYHACAQTNTSSFPAGQTLKHGARANSSIQTSLCERDKKLIGWPLMPQGSHLRVGLSRTY